MREVLLVRVGGVLVDLDGGADLVPCLLDPYVETPASREQTDGYTVAHGLEGAMRLRQNGSGSLRSVARALCPEPHQLRPLLGYQAFVIPLHPWAGPKREPAPEAVELLGGGE